MPATKGKRRILLVDDHPVVRRGLASLIAEEPDLVVIGELEKVSSTLQEIRKAKPDLVVLDLSMSDENGLEILERFSARLPRLQALVFSRHEEEYYAERTLRAGARGYVMKQEDPNTLLQAIRTVLGGKIYLSPRITRLIRLRRPSRKATATDSGIGALTRRELRVYRLLGNGLNPREMARKLGISLKTVDAHRQNIMEKLGVGSLRELLNHAALWNGK